MKNKKHKKVCKTLIFIEQFLVLGCSITGCVSISAFAFLVGVYIGITNSAIELTICAITVGIKKCKSIIMKKKRKYTIVIKI